MAGLTVRGGGARRLPGAPTLTALVLVTLLAGPLGPVNLMLLTAVLLEASARCAGWLSPRDSSVRPQASSGEEPVGGGIFA
ncbi:MAG: hypothetical protein ACK5AZ_27295, partial [Bryobacteraceae bacterium]